MQTYVTQRPISTQLCTLKYSEPWKTEIFCDLKIPYPTKVSVRHSWVWFNLMQYHEAFYLVCRERSIRWKQFVLHTFKGGIRWRRRSFTRSHNCLYITVTFNFQFTPWLFKSLIDFFCWLKLIFTCPLNLKSWTILLRNHECGNRRQNSFSCILLRLNTSSKYFIPQVWPVSLILVIPVRSFTIDFFLDFLNASKLKGIIFFLIFIFLQKKKIEITTFVSFRKSDLRVCEYQYRQ